MQILSMLLAQDSNGVQAVVVLIQLAVITAFFAGLWATFTKAGQPGWACLVPFYNLYILLKIAGRPGWWILLFLIPLVNIVVSIIAYIDFAKSYGKGAGFGIGLLFLSFIFFPILGFGDARYQGPAAAAA